MWLRLDEPRQGSLNAPSLQSAAMDPAASALRRPLLFAGAIMLAVFVPYYLLTIDPRWPIPRDGTGLAVGRDFLNFWLYGRAAHGADPGRYYDWPTYWAAVEAVAGTDYPGQQWSYPPSLMLIAAPFGLLPYLPALAMWSVIGLTAFVATLRRWTADRQLLAIGLLAPAGIFGLVSGQLAWIGAAALLAGLRWRERRPVTAGILFGLLTIKPQLGVLLPVLLIATRSWRVITAAVGTAALVAGLTTAIWGMDVWAAWFGRGVAQQSGVLTDGSLIVAPFMPTIYMNLRLAGVPIGGANAVQVALLLLAVGVVWRTFRRRPAADDRRATAIFLAASFVATPYLMAYDGLAIGVAAVLWADASGRGRRLASLVWLLPLVNMALANVGIPGAALIPLAWLGWLVLSAPDDAP